MDTPTRPPCCCGHDAVEPEPSRRGFMAATLAVVAGAVACLPAAIAGLCASIVHPLTKKGQAGQFVRLGSLDTLPADGTPVKSTVLMDQVDAWNRAANQPVGAVFLRRVGQEVQAFNVVCPHAGCSVEFKEEVDPGTNQKKTKFFCPCHVASFDLEGRRTDATSPAPRDLDTLTVDVRGTEVWVQFQNFQVGIPSKVPAA